jgi:hypothetical protein
MLYETTAFAGQPGIITGCKIFSITSTTNNSLP